MTSAFVPLSEDELNVQKVMGEPVVISALGKELNPNQKLTDADLKIGAGQMSPEIEEAFKKPVFKTSKVVLGGSGVGSAAVSKRKMSQDEDKIGAGGTKKRQKMFSGRGVKFT